MSLQWAFDYFVSPYLVLGTLLLLVASLSDPERKKGIRLAGVPGLLMIFLLSYGLAVSFFFWLDKGQRNWPGAFVLSILSMIVSVGIISIFLMPIHYLLGRIFQDYFVETRIFNIAVYSAFVPLLYIFAVTDLSLGPVLELFMATGLAISFAQIFRGILYCLQTSPGQLSHWGKNSYSPFLMVVSWLLVLLLNLYALILLVARNHSQGFISHQGPVHDPLELLYFTVITFTGVGYGDIIPQGRIPVLVSILISLTGFLYSALFIGSILAAFTHFRRD